MSQWSSDGAPQRRIVKQASQVLPLKSDDFISSDEEGQQDFFAPPQSSGSPGCLSVRGLSEDATWRELHILFSACQGYTCARLAVEERTQRVQGLVQFDSQEHAMRALQRRQGTLWEADGKPIMLDPVGPEIADRLLRTALPPGANLNGGRQLQANGMYDNGYGYGQGDATPPRTPSKSRALTPQPAGSARSRTPQDGRQSRTPPPPKVGQRGEVTLRPDGTPRNVRPMAYVAEFKNHKLAAKADPADRIKYFKNLHADELQMIITEAEEIGVPRPELIEAKEVFREKTQAQSRHKCSHAMSRAKARIGEMSVPGPLGLKPWEVESKSQDEIERLSNAIREGQKAARLCQDARLESREKMLRKEVRTLLDRWKFSCASRMEAYIRDRQHRMLSRIVPEAERLWVLEEAYKFELPMEVPPHELLDDVRVHGDPWQLFETAKRIAQGSQFEDEEKAMGVRKGLQSDMASGSAHKFRQALERLKAEVQLDDWERNKYEATLKSLEEKACARWGLISFSLTAKNTVEPWDFPGVIQSLRQAINFSEQVDLEHRYLEAPTDLVSAMTKLMHNIDRVQGAMSSGNVAELDTALRAAQESGMPVSPLAKSFFDKAGHVLQEEKNKASATRRMEAAMAGRKTHLLKTMPEMLKEGKSAGVRDSVLEKAQAQVSQATATNRLEQALQAKEKDVHELKVAIEEGRKANVSQKLLGDAKAACDQAECRKEIDFAIQRQDADMLKRAMQTWQQKGFGSDVLQSAKVHLEKMEARKRDLKVKLEQALQPGIAFEEHRANITAEGMKVVETIAGILKESSSTIEVQIDSHVAAGKNDGAGKKMSQTRADAVKEALQQLKVQNRIDTKGWGSSHPTIKRRLIRIYPGPGE